MTRRARPVSRSPESPKSLLRRILVRRARRVLRESRRASRSASRASVHDLRVATRRLEEALEFFDPCLPEEACSRLRRRSRRIRRSLGDLRNADVMVDLLSELRSRLGDREGRSLRTLARELAARAAVLRRRHQRRGIPGARRRIRALLEAVHEEADGVLGRRTRTVLSARAREVRGSLRPARGGGAEALHRLRVSIKRHRYALEIAQQAGLAPPGAAIARAREVQESLGRLHDLDVLLGLLVRRGGAGGRALLPKLRAERRERFAAAQRVLRDFRPWPGVGRPRPGASA